MYGELVWGRGVDVHEHLSPQPLKQDATRARPSTAPVTDNNLAKWRPGHFPEAQERAPPRGAKGADVVVRGVAAL